MMWRVVLIGTAGTLIAIPVWLGLYSAIGHRGVRPGLHPGDDRLCSGVARRLGSRLGVVAGAVPRPVDSPWPDRRRCRCRGRISNRVLIFGGENLDLWEAIAAAAVGGLTTLAVFLGVSYLLRGPSSSVI